MNSSLNEIEALSRKAVRGAGYSWGLAEEGGKTVRWLSSMHLPGTEALASLLPLIDNASYATLCPDVATTHWTASGGTLCPLACGPALSDRAAELGDGISLGRVAHPLLLLPYVSSMAELSGQTVQIAWDGFQASLAPARALHIACADATSVAIADQVEITPTDAVSGPLQTSVYRYDLNPEIASVLGQFAHRTYAPDTPESRASGAGSSLSDND